MKVTFEGTPEEIKEAIHCRLDDIGQLKLNADVNLDRDSLRRSLEAMRDTSSKNIRKLLEKR